MTVYNRGIKRDVIIAKSGDFKLLSTSRMCVRYRDGKGVKGLANPMVIQTTAKDTIPTALSRTGKGWGKRKRSQ